MTGRFDSKVVLVTGASAGVGAATARRFAAQGAQLALNARRKEPLEELAGELRAGGARVHVIPGDVGRVEDCEALVQDCVDTLGGLDVLVNNAGAHFRGPVQQRSPAEIAAMIDVNVRGPLVLSRLALPHLQRGGGAIVNVASLAGKVPLPEAATYSASKFALRAFSIALAEELRGTAVTVSLVSPGPIVDTGFLMDSLEEAADVVFAQPMSTADEVADMILACARDGRRERVKPRVSALLATAAYLVPPTRRLLEPLMKAQGRRRKARYRNQRAAQRP